MIRNDDPYAQEIISILADLRFNLNFLDLHGPQKVARRRLAYPSDLEKIGHLSGMTSDKRFGNRHHRNNPPSTPRTSAAPNPPDDRRARVPNTSRPISFATCRPSDELAERAADTAIFSASEPSRR